MIIKMLTSTLLYPKHGPEPVSGSAENCRGVEDSDTCCAAHHLYIRDLLFTSSASFSCDFKTSSGFVQL